MAVFFKSCVWIPIEGFLFGFEAGMKIRIVYITIGLVLKRMTFVSFDKFLPLYFTVLKLAIVAFSPIQTQFLNEKKVWKNMLYQGLHYTRTNFLPNELAKMR